MADSQYADDEYYQPSPQDMPKGPLAIPHVTRDAEGNAKTIYLDLNTGQEVKNLKDYTIYDGNQYWTPKKSDDTNKDDKIDPGEVAKALPNMKANSGSGKSVVAGGGPKGTASNNFGYQHKPGFLGPAATIAGLVNPGVGAVGSMLSKAYNVNNMDAVNNARKGLGLSALSGKSMVKGAFKDNKGQIANVNIGDNKYSVGFEAMSPDKKTNLTYNEAKTRAAILGRKVTETPKDEVTAPPEEAKQQSLMSKITGLDKGFARRALGIEKKTPEAKVEAAVNPKESPASKVTGLQKGWLSKALTDLTTTNKVTPEVASKMPETISKTVAPSKEASIGLPDKAVGPSQANPLGVGAGSVGFAGAMASNPAKAAVNTARSVPAGAIVDGSKPDHLGRVGLMSVDFDKMGLQSAQAAQMKSYQQKAIDAGIADKLSVDVTHAVRTPEQQAAIQAAGFSKTKLGYHNIGLAVDVSPTAINAKDQITDQETLDKSRAIAQELGMNTLDKSWDPAHIESRISGMTAKQISQQPIDPQTGLPSLSPEQDLSVRQSSVPTPTARPAPTAPEQDRNYAGQAYQGVTPSSSLGEDAKTNTGSVANAPNAGNFTSQDERSSLNDRLGMTAAPAQETNAFGKMKQDMSSLATPNAVSPTASVNLGNSPAALAAMGFTNRTPEERAAISRTIAGELGQKSLRALSSDDPAARANALAEVGSIAATIENRAATTKFAGVAKTIAPSQYNANFASNAKVTNQNYANNPAVSKAVGQFYNGGIPGTQYGATNYHATAMANPPSWSGQMADATQLGQHTFGTLPGYSPDAATQAAQKAFGTMAGTQFSPGKKTDDTVSNPGFSGMNTPGGMKSSLGSSSATTGLGVHDPSKSNTPGYGGAGLGYSGASSGAAAGSLGNPGGSSGAGGASGSQGSSSSSSSGSSSSGSSSSGSNGGGSSSNSRSGSSSPAGGYASGASKGSTGGL